MKTINSLVLAIGLSVLAGPRAALADTVTYRITGVSVHCLYGACPVDPITGLPAPISFSTDSAVTIDATTFLAEGASIQIGSEIGSECAGVPCGPELFKGQPTSEGTPPTIYEWTNADGSLLDLNDPYFATTTGEQAGMLVYEHNYFAQGGYLLTPARTAPVPEASSILLFATGLLSLFGTGFRRKRTG
jgi:hypothetical protein